MQNLCEQNFTIVSWPLCSSSCVPTFYLWGQLISVSKAPELANVLCTSTGHLYFNFAPLSVIYKLFPEYILSRELNSKYTRIYK